MTEKEFREKERSAAAKKAAAKKKAKKRRNVMIAVTVTLSVTVIVLIALIIAAFLRIEVVEIEGNSIYTAEQIVEVADIEAGNSLVFLKREAVSEKLRKKLPFIEEVTIEKKMPSTLKITVIETTEDICFYDSGVYYSASKSGKILNEYSTAPDGLCVVVTGDGFTFQKGEEYSCSENVKAELLATLLYYCEKSETNETIINISDMYKSYFVMEDKSVVFLGSSSYIDEKLKFLPKMIESSEDEKYNYFDLSNWTPDYDEAVLQSRDDINSYLEIK